MDDPIAVALKFAFLALLFLFIFWVVRSSSRELADRQAEDFDPLLDAAGGRAPIDLKAGVRPRLVVVAANRYETGSSFDLLGGLLLGRDKPAEVIVDDVFASARHARITARGPYNYLEDLGSTNGTYLNGVPVESTERLTAGDKITIGDTEFRYEE
jgi:hypothetical protein